MAKTETIRVRVDRETLQRLRAEAERQSRNMSNLAYLYLKRALKAEVRNGKGC
jgi:hypothetical protein